MKAAYPTEAVLAADPPGNITTYEADRVATQCVRTGRPILIAHADWNGSLSRIARDDRAAHVAGAVGAHSTWPSR